MPAALAKLSLSALAELRRASLRCCRCDNQRAGSPGFENCSWRTQVSVQVIPNSPTRCHATGVHCCSDPPLNLPRDGFDNPPRQTSSCHRARHAGYYCTGLCGLALSSGHRQNLRSAPALHRRTVSESRLGEAGIPCGRLESSGKGH